MAYRIRRKDKSVEVAVRRIAREQLAKAMHAVADGHLSSHDVHAVRVRCKKIRALLRLVRPCFDRFAEEDARLRDLARRLAQVRDTDVISKLAAGLLQAQGGDDMAWLAVVLSTSDKSAGDEPAMADMAASLQGQLQEAYDATPDWRLDAYGWDAVQGGLKRTYRSAKGKLDKVIEQPTSENFHAMRRHSKYHLYHTSLLVRLAPGKMRQRARQLDRLCGILGDDHDLSMLDQALGTARLKQEAPHLAEALHPLVRRQQAMVRPQAIHQAKLLFAQSPGELVRDWGKRLAQWK